MNARRLPDLVFIAVARSSGLRRTRNSYFLSRGFHHMTEKHIDFLIAAFFICLYLLLTSPRRPTRARPNTP